MSQTEAAEGLTAFEQQFADLFAQGKVTLPGQIRNSIDSTNASEGTEDTETATDDLDDDNIELAEEESEGAEEDEEEDAEDGEEASDESGDEEAGGGEEPAPVTSAATALPDFTGYDRESYDKWWDEHIAAPEAPVVIGGVEYTPSQAVDLQRAYAFASTLDPNDVAAVNALLSGQYRLVPAADVGAPQSPPPAAGQAAPQVVPTEDEDYEPLDPIAAQRIAAMEAEVAGLREQSAQQSQLAMIETIHAASEAWTEEHGYDPAVRARLEQHVFDSQWMPVLVQQTGGDYARATRAALELAAQSDPQLRQAEIDRLALEQAEQVRAATKQTSAKKRKAGSLGGAGGSVSRGVRPPSTPQERKDAMVAEIASMVGSGQDQ